MTTLFEFLLSASALVAVALLLTHHAASLAATTPAAKLEAWQAVTECNLLYFAPYFESAQARFSNATLPLLERHCLADVRLTASGKLVVEAS